MNGCLVTVTQMSNDIAPLPWNDAEARRAENENQTGKTTEPTALPVRLPFREPSGCYLHIGLAQDGEGRPWEGEDEPILGHRDAAEVFTQLGCGPTIASRWMLTELIVGKLITKYRELSVESLIEASKACRPISCIEMREWLSPEVVHSPATSPCACQRTQEKHEWMEHFKDPKNFKRRNRIF